MVRMYVKRDRHPYRKGQVVVMGPIEALWAVVAGWAEPIRDHEKATNETREVR